MDGREVADERLDPLREARRRAHSSAPALASTAATREPSRIGGRHGLDVAGERPVVAQPRRQLPHRRARGSSAGSRLERRVELDRLRTCKQLDRHRALRVREHLPRLEAGRVPHRDVILLPRARRDRVDRRRMAEHLVLGDERGGHVLRDHEAAVEAAVGGEEGRQALGEVRVDEALESPLGDVRELGDGHGERVEGEGERLSVEVAVRDEQLVVDEHERVVGGGVQLHRGGVLRVLEEVAARAVHLWRAAERVRVLHLVAPAMRLDDRRALEQAEDVRGRGFLPSQRPELMDLREERGPRPLQGLDGDRARDVGGPCQPSRPHEPEREHRRHELGAVDEREPLLRRQLHGLETDPRERVGARQSFAFDPCLALADERQREMRERREVARGADRASARHVRQHASVEEREEQLDGLDPSPRVPLRERVRAEEHRRADDLGGIRVTDAAGVRAEQSQLQLGGLLFRDRDGNEAAESGVDAVGVLAAPVRGALDELAGCTHPLPCLVGQLDAGSIDRHRPDVVNGQVVAREADRRPLRHHASLGRRSRRPLPYVPPGGFATPCRHRIGAGVTRLSRLGRGFVPEPASPRLVGDKPQLEHVRRIQSRHPEQRAGRRDGGTCRQQPNELRTGHAEPSRGRLPLDRCHHLVQRRRSPVLDVEAYLHVSRPREAESERADAGEAAVALPHRTRHFARGVEVVAREVDVEGDQRRARPDQHAARALVEPRWTEVRSELAGVDAPLQLGRASAPEERRRLSAAQLAVEEDRKLELSTDPLRKQQRRRTGALHVIRPHRDKRHDVGRTDPRVHALVAPQVDACLRNGDRGEERVDHLGVVADERENGAVVVGIRVDVEQPGTCGELLSEQADHDWITALGEVRHGLERQHRDGPYAPRR